MPVRRPASASLCALLDGADPEPIIDLLEPMVSDARRRRLSEVIEQRLESVTVVMDAPHDPHNGAAVMRSCDAFGVYRLHVIERTEPFAASTAVAMGTERWVDALGYPTVAEALETLAAGDYCLVAAHPEGELLPEALRSLPRLALVLGNEHDGICRELEAACERRVRVPMRGFVESLNVSVTAGILLSYATTGRPGDVPPAERRRLYARGLMLTVPRALEILEAKGISLR